MGLFFVFLFGLIIWFVSKAFDYEGRAVAMIKGEANARGWKIKEMTHSNQYDGSDIMNHPDNFDYSVRILGMPRYKERVYVRVLLIEHKGKEQKLWARVTLSRIDSDRLEFFEILQY